MTAFFEMTLYETIILIILNTVRNDSWTVTDHVYLKPLLRP